MRKTDNKIRIFAMILCFVTIFSFLAFANNTTECTLINVTIINGVSYYNYNCQNQTNITQINITQEQFNNNMTMLLEKISILDNKVNNISRINPANFIENISLITARIGRMEHSIEVYNSTVSAETLKAMQIFNSTINKTISDAVANKTHNIIEQLDSMYQNAENNYAKKADLNTSTNNIMTVYSNFAIQTNQALSNAFWTTLVLMIIISAAISFIVTRLKISRIRPLRHFTKKVPTKEGYIEDLTTKTDIKDIIKKHINLKEYAANLKTSDAIKSRIFTMINNTEVDSIEDIRQVCKVMEEEKRVKEVPHRAKDRQRRKK